MLRLNLKEEGPRVPSGAISHMVRRARPWGRISPLRASPLSALAVYDVLWWRAQARMSGGGGSGRLFIGHSFTWGGVVVKILAKSDPNSAVEVEAVSVLACCACARGLPRCCRPPGGVVIG